METGSTNKILKLIIVIMVVLGTMGEVNASQGDGLGTPVLSRWYMNKKAAVSLRFDDNLESHVRTVIPLLNKYDLKATFMVSPGRRSFLKNKGFWTEKVLPMGHELGNHTMHHRGARTLEEAKFEINEASRIIRNLYSDEDRVLVFASGGGKSWGGRRWSEADKHYWDIARESSLIDLYDGSHPYFGAVTKTTVEEIESVISSAVIEGKHQAFTFHHVGSRRLKDWAKQIILGKSWNFPVERFEIVLSQLADKRDEIWVAPLGNILKYETELKETRILNLVPIQDGISFEFFVGSDSEQYDHELSVFLPSNGDGSYEVRQDERAVMTIEENGLLLFNLRPENSVVRIVEISERGH